MAILERLVKQLAKDFEGLELGSPEDGHQALQSEGVQHRLPLGESTGAAPRGGATSASGWRTVQRWVGVARAGWLFPCLRRAPLGWTDRQVAERVAMTTLATFAPLAPGPPDLVAGAFFGAALAG